MRAGIRCEVRKKESRFCSRCEKRAGDLPSGPCGELRGVLCAGRLGLGLDLKHDTTATKQDQREAIARVMGGAAGVPELLEKVVARADAHFHARLLLVGKWRALRR